MNTLFAYLHHRICKQKAGLIRDCLIIIRGSGRLEKGEVFFKFCFLFAIGKLSLLIFFTQSFYFISAIPCEINCCKYNKKTKTNIK